MNVIKRSGEEVVFTSDKIANAIRKASNATEDNPLSEQEILNITDNVVEQCSKIKRSMSVEEIQDLVETELMKSGHYAVAHNYITYRYKRELVRKSNSTDRQILSLLERNNEEVKQENSNKNPLVKYRRISLSVSCFHPISSKPMKMALSTSMMRTIMLNICIIAALSILKTCYKMAL